MQKEEKVIFSLRNMFVYLISNYRFIIQMKIYRIKLNKFYIG